MKQTSLVAISDLNLCKICPCFTHELIKIYVVKWDWVTPTSLDGYFSVLLLRSSEKDRNSPGRGARQLRHSG